MSWYSLSSSESTGSSYARPLCPCETNFLYDRKFNGTADIIWRYTVAVDPAIGARIFNEENVKRTWATLKQWYPLLGARVDDSGGMDSATFVVSAHALSHHHPDEVTLRAVPSTEEVDSVVWFLLRDNPMVDHHLISRVFIFALGDAPGTYQVMMKVSHIVADGIAGVTIARTFFDVLVSPPSPIPPLEERLAMTLPPEQLNPTRNMSLARQRWRRAIAQVTFLNRRRTLQGGHAIPRTVTDKTFCTPTITDRVGFRFTKAQTTAILAACKRRKVTFGAVAPVISQLATARILHRRYFRGEISEAEWEHRRKQPMHFGGPINLRPFMDADWQRKGGSMEVELLIDFYECTLPFMPTPFGMRRDDSVPRSDGAPPYETLLSPERFFYRARLFNAQLQKITRHPLMLDLAAVRQPAYIVRKKYLMESWRATARGEPLSKLSIPPHVDSVPPDYVPSNGLSSVGQLSLILPENYPLPDGHPLSVRTLRAANTAFDPLSKASTAIPRPAKPPVTSDADAVLRIIDSATFLHSRPMEFFLASSTERHQIGMTVTFDANVYPRADAEEFMQECRAAVTYYLGADTMPRARL